MILSAILLNALNPKLSIFFFAFLPQFVSARDPHPLPRMLELSAVFMALTFVVFVGYGDESSNPALELTYNWGKDDGYTIGDGYGHIAIAVPDLYGFCETLSKEGVEIPRPPGPLKHGGANVIAFIKDPDGYLIALGTRQ